MTSRDSDQIRPDAGLDASLRNARVRESAHLQAVMAIRDAQTLRLQVLHDELAPIVRSRRETGDFIDLALIPADPPRLWLDLTSYVIMAPDPRTFRLVQDTQNGAETLFETKDRAQMLAKLTEFTAHRTVERQRALPARPHGGAPPAGKYATATLLLAWLTGFSFGVLALLAAGIWFTRPL